ncbi:MAG TPA: bifunctional diguanylate cyclase/phosphodiesterase [Allosphingosinicella sp.]|nr:bifunctional diguanylate cyclase/phosphodiesterase [Allosphingosinicella sp.]
MAAAQIRARRDRAIEEPAEAALADAAADLPQFFLHARQHYLDALPIAAAILEPRAGGYILQAANDPFRSLAEHDERLGERRVSQVRLLSSGEVGQRLAAFLGGDEPSHQFEGSDGPSVAARHFLVRFSRVRALADGPVRILVSFIDRTSQVDTERHLRSEMLLDSLTGLPNRLAFNERVDALLGEPELAEGSHAVLALDMTRFSRVNECMGAMAGDELLITFARRLVSALRPTDMLARTSGDEFAILMKLGRGMTDALRAAERIKAVLTLPFRLTDLEIRVDCAIGCAMLSPGVSSAEEVLRNAQFALKRAKRVGMTQVYEPVQAQAVRRRFSMETELRRAIEAEELTLAFQPLIELRTGQVYAFEALARWRNDPDGPISPGEFIPVAEESGLIVPLGRWALETATRTMAEWDRQVGRELPFSVSVNLSAIQISRDDVAAVVQRALAGSGIPGRRLTLELTESAIIHDPDRAASVLRALKELDVKVAMDDFGTGYTSLASLQRLPIDLLKIDRSLVANLPRDADAAAIVRAILSLADALGMDTLAEGIERAELGEVLAAMGCTYGQGFHYARPLEADAALAYWLERNA